METTKTRKQGNAIMLTVPKSFNIDAGVTVKPILTDKGIFYKFVDENDFFDFSEDILEDLVSQGYEGKELITKFKETKNKLPQAMTKLIGEAKQGPILSKKEAAKEIGL